ncbi:hypothetical protein BGZ63DRAFT_427619 [Mariannaea sp. PMI_226]|nr:hypothetical protein BGZ63DRAFT_427619 [Mariannaea sp. PMI_226]
MDSEEKKLASRLKSALQPQMELLDIEPDYFELADAEPSAQGACGHNNPVAGGSVAARLSRRTLLNQVVDMLIV